MIGSQLQTAIFAALTSANICNGRVFDRVEGAKSFPYVTIGDEDVGDIGNDCADAWESNCAIHVWSRPKTGSKVELKNILAAIQPIVCTTSLAVEGFKISIATLESVRAYADPDGQTQHGVLSVTYSLHPTS